MLEYLDTADAIADALEEEVSRVTDELWKLRDVLGIEDPDILREAIQDAILEPMQATLTQAENLDKLQLEAHGDVELTEPAAYAYLGPTDLITRPFCAALRGKRLSRLEIDQLDNKQLPNAWVTRGGYNCRHGWYAIYGDEVEEFPQGSVEEANAAARR